MNRKIKHTYSIIFLIFCLGLVSCSEDDTPTAPGQSVQLKEAYSLVSVTDKQENITTNAGELTDLDGAGGASPEGVLTGGIQFNGNEFIMTIIITPANASPVVLEAVGTYSLSDNVIRFEISNSNIPGVEAEITTMNIISGESPLILEDEERRLVFDE